MNRDTHTFDDLRKAELTGWQRSWSHRVHSSIRKTSSLSIEPAPDVTIKGLISSVSPGLIAQLDAREAGYNLHVLPSKSLNTDTNAKTVHTYISANGTSGDTEYPILQSYLDTVLLGFLKEFGEAGVSHFLSTTVGWETPILSDRTEPLYPRAQPISNEAAKYFDAELKNLGADWIDQAL